MRTFSLFIFTIFLSGLTASADPTPSLWQQNFDTVIALQDRPDSEKKQYVLDKYLGEWTIDSSATTNAVLLNNINSSACSEAELSIRVMRESEVRRFLSNPRSELTDGQRNSIIRDFMPKKVLEFSFHFSGCANETTSLSGVRRLVLEEHGTVGTFDADKTFAYRIRGEWQPEGIFSTNYRFTDRSNFSYSIEGKKEVLTFRTTNYGADITLIPDSYQAVMVRK